MKDFYQLLGVPESAGDIEIKKAYRKLAKMYHPDANPGNKQAENKFKEISEAHEILANKQKRAQYDQMRKYGSQGFGGFNEQRQHTGFKNSGNFDDLSSIFGEYGGLGSFADIFSSIFGDTTMFRGGRPGRAGGPAAGEDLYSEIEIPFETAVNGGKVKIRLNITEQCHACHGSGSKPGTSARICPECHGRGNITFSQGSFAVSRPCPRCLGRGQIIGEPCPNCRGSGSTKGPREVAIEIPKGIASGTNLRLKGLGNPGLNGGPPGELYLKINISGHHFFWREGLNIHCRVPINIRQAARGSKIRVRTITDKKVDLTIPPSTSNGTRFRLKGFGLTEKNRRGDQIVEIEIKVSSKINDEEKKLFDELGEKLGVAR